MAKLNEQMFVIKVSELLRDNQEAKPPLDAEIMSQLEAVIGELAPPAKPPFIHAETAVDGLAFGKSFRPFHVETAVLGLVLSCRNTIEPLSYLFYLQNH